MDNPAPMTPEQATAAVEAMQASLESHGAWNKVCVHCGRSCGGRLAAYGKPDADDMRGVCCPVCPIPPGEYDGNDHVRLEFVPPEAT
jgi:hypothetical protein